jgi:hypothetical protein
LRRGSALLLAALLAPGCALSAEGEIPDVEVTRHGVLVPGAPLEARIGDGVVVVPVSFDPTDHLTVENNSYRSVKVREVAFKMNSALPDLSFIRTLRMTIQGKGTATPIEVARYQRDDTAPPVGPVLSLPRNPPVEVLPAWTDPPCVINIEVQGSLPEDSWTVDVTVRLSAEVAL